MANIPESAIQKLCHSLQIDPEFFVQCLHESVVKIHEVEGRFDLDNGTVLRLRQLERLCLTLDVNVSVGLLLLELTHQVSELEERVRQLRSPQ